MKYILFAGFMMTVSFSSFAQDVVTTSDITLTKALSIAQLAANDCVAKGFPVAVAVTDSAGNLKAAIRTEGAGSFTVEAAQKKAFTSASTKTKTSDLAARQNNPGAQNLNELPGWLLLAGGVPVQIEGATVGAIGVSGAPSGNIDEDCAEAGLGAEDDVQPTTRKPTVRF